MYYGDGKGKTTAAMGLAVRALGRGLKVHIIQFIKGTWTTGEMEPLIRLGAGFEQMGKGFYKMMDDKLPPEEHMKAARNGLERAFELIACHPELVEGLPSEENTKEVVRQAHHDNRVDVLILDEILRAVQEGLLSQDDCYQLINSKPPELHLVMTGHTVWSELLERADMVSEMKKVKHPFDQGILAQIGVDF